MGAFNALAEATRSGPSPGRAEGGAEAAPESRLGLGGGAFAWAGSGFTFGFYAVLNALFFVFTIFFVPETKGVSLEHIEANLMAGKPLRNIGA